MFRNHSQDPTQTTSNRRVRGARKAMAAATVAATSLAAACSPGGGETNPPKDTMPAVTAPAPEATSTPDRERLTMQRAEKYRYLYGEQRNALLGGFLDEAGARIAEWANNAEANDLNVQFVSYELAGDYFSDTKGWGRLELLPTAKFPHYVTATVYRDGENHFDPTKGATSFSYKSTRGNQSVAVYAPDHPEHPEGSDVLLSDPQATPAYTVVISGHSGNNGPVADQLVSGTAALFTDTTQEQLEAFEGEFFSCAQTGFDQMSEALHG